MMAEMTTSRAMEDIYFPIACTKTNIHADSESSVLGTNTTPHADQKGLMYTIQSR